MSAVSETIVREFFESHGFFVHQHRKYVAPAKREDEEIDFFLLNPQASAAGGADLPFELSPSDLPRLARAIVVVKGWHTETFSAGLLAATPELFRFAEPAAFREAARTLGGSGPVTRILVVPTLPSAAEARAQSVAFLKSRGVDAVLPFRTILAALIDGVEVNRNYQKSDLLQMLRILKNYEFLREPQLELFKAARRRPARPSRASRDPVAPADSAS